MRRKDGNKTRPQDWKYIETMTTKKHSWKLGLQVEFDLGFIYILMSWKQNQTTENCLEVNNNKTRGL